MKDEKKKYPWFRSIFKKKKDEPDDPGMDDVYAGPEFFEQGEPEEPENEDAVEPETSFGPMECVYAGPDMMDEPDPRMTTIYGGPDMTGPPDPRMMMAVYAGPEFFAGTYKPIGATAPEPEEPKSGNYCHFCGTPLREGEKFCRECGTPIPSDD